MGSSAKFICTVGTIMVLTLRDTGGVNLKIKHLAKCLIHNEINTYEECLTFREMCRLNSVLLSLYFIP